MERSRAPLVRNVERFTIRPLAPCNNCRMAARQTGARFSPIAATAFPATVSRKQGVAPGNLAHPLQYLPAPASEAAPRCPNRGWNRRDLADCQVRLGGGLRPRLARSRSPGRRRLQNAAMRTADPPAAFASSPGMSRPRPWGSDFNRPTLFPRTRAFPARVFSWEFQFIPRLLHGRQVLNRNTARHL